MGGDRPAAHHWVNAELERFDPSPVVTISRAVAVGFAEGPQAGAGGAHAEAIALTGDDAVRVALERRRREAAGAA